MTAIEGDTPAPRPPVAHAPAPGRPVWALVGALLLVVLGVAMLVPAVHIATRPILLPTAAGPPFDCGTALNPPAKAFPVKVCGAEPRLAQQQAAAWTVAAIVVGVGGALAFLLPTRTRPVRRSRRRAGDSDEEATPAG